jgi:hypothetical protein
MMDQVNIGKLFWQSSQSTMRWHRSLSYSILSAMKSSNPPFVATLLLLAAVVASAQPQIALHGIVNNASFTPYGFRNYGIAQGAVFAVFGSGMGPDGLALAQSFPLGKELSGTSVRITAGNDGYDAFPRLPTPSHCT